VISPVNVNPQFAAAGGPAIGDIGNGGNNFESPSSPSPSAQFDNNGNDITPQRARRSIVKQSKDSLELAQEMATQDPKIVAGIIKNWVNENE
jgi:flagellar biosynthesis/type III secretory pathway M-ring protein FliF/YscJ